MRICVFFVFLPLAGAPGPISCDFGLGPAFLSPARTGFLLFRSWGALPGGSQDRIPAFPVLARLSGPLPSPDPRISRPGMPLRTLAKPVFLHFPSWDALPGGSQDRFPAIPVLAEYSPTEFARILRDLQNPGTAFRCRGAWDADRCEKRANILTDLSRSYALYSPGTWISMPALCKSRIVPRAAGVSQDQFPAIPVLARLFGPLLSPDPCVSRPGVPFRSKANPICWRLVLWS